MGAVPVASDEPGIARYERPERLPPDLRATRTYMFDGGCVTYQFAFDGPASATLTVEIDEALSFVSRDELVAEVRQRTGGLRLCGAAVPCPGAHD